MSVTIGNSSVGDIYYGATKITDAYLGSELVYTNTVPALTLTLETDGHGTLTANTVSGYAGDTVELTTAYNTYYRFSGYDVTGGTIESNTFTFGDEDATAYAAFKPNSFTATGNFEQGSNVAITAAKYNYPAAGNVPAKYAVHVSHTGDVPDSWYSTSNRWKPTNASSYVMNVSPNMKFTCIASGSTANKACHGRYNITAQSLVNNSVLNSTVITTALTSTREAPVNAVKYFTTTGSTNVQNYTMLSAKLSANNVFNSSWARAIIQYNATTNGTWSATGYAP